MQQIHKTIECAFKSEVNSKNLFDSADLLLHEKDNFLIHDFLEICHLPAVNKIISSSNKIDEWFDLLLRLITKSNFNIYSLLQQRAKQYGAKPLFQTISNKSIAALSYNKSWHIIQAIGTFLKSDSTKHHTIGILSSNSPRGAPVSYTHLTLPTILLV